MHKALVTGATSQIGFFLLQRLPESGIEVHALSRKAAASKSGVFWHLADIEKGELPTGTGADTLIHLAPIWLLPGLIDLAASRGIERIIAFSSTSRFTKRDSKNSRERLLAEKLEASERRVAEKCSACRIAWTIFRPTLVYCPGRDRNLTAVSRFIEKFSFFPLVGKGLGLRQPVHAADLALACLQALDNENTTCKSYNLSGGETLPYREMVEKIFRAMKKKPRFVSIPLPVFRMALGLSRALPKYRYFSAEMADRMNQDLCFDHDAAAADFGYAPAPFSWECGDNGA